jgi:hypothetical protein
MIFELAGPGYSLCKDRFSHVAWPLRCSAKRLAYLLYALPDQMCGFQACFACRLECHAQLSRPS